MKSMVKGVFQYRKSKRLAEVEIDGEIVEAYMSNGSEIPFLRPGAVCYLREAESETRRTRYDLFSVYDGDTLVCVDAKEPLRIVLDMLKEKYSGEGVFIYEDTRTSVIFRYRDRKDEGMVQVMGTSLVKNRVAYLPEIRSTILCDRLNDLLRLKAIGTDPELIVVICRDDADSFEPNAEADPYFASLLAEVIEAGIPVKTLRCIVDENGMSPE